MSTDIAANIAGIRARMADAAQRAGRQPSDIVLCAVCKGQDSALIRQSAGLVDCFGENRAQEMLLHASQGAHAHTPVHFIGHLQTNKAKDVVGRVQLIHSVDRDRLLARIAALADSQALVQDILIQVNIGAEASKSGLSPDELPALLDAAAALPGVRVRGLMAIPPPADSTENRRYFARMRALLTQAQTLHPDMPLDTLSMGMSDSFEDAILEGATIVRVGSAIYGQRS